MNLIGLDKKNMLQYKDQIDLFFLNNKDSWKYFHPHDSNWNALYSIVIESSKDFYGLFMKEGNLIGYGILRGWDDGFDIPSLGLIIDKNSRGKGFSKILMKKLHGISKTNGAKKIRLTVLKENLGAINLYKSMGYTLSEMDNNNLIGFKDL